MKAFQSNWLRESEHIALRLVSLVFSIGSAYAVRWFFSPLDAGDPIHYVLWWIVAAGFGLLGFYLSRSLTHRMMSKEPIWAYAPVFLLVEFFEVLCNYAKAVTVVADGGAVWVAHAPSGQQVPMMILTYIGWSIIPLVSPTMAVADMDMTRRRSGEIGAAAPSGRSVGQAVGQRPAVPAPLGPTRPAAPTTPSQGGGRPVGQPLGQRPAPPVGPTRQGVPVNTAQGAASAPPLAGIAQVP